VLAGIAGVLTAHFHLRPLAGDKPHQVIADIPYIDVVPLKFNKDILFRKRRLSLGWSHCVAAMQQAGGHQHNMKSPAG
jgi:hypothetical protein